MISRKYDIPVKLECDVAVIGGGPAGICAAVSAAREGAKTVLIERYGILGGMMTSGHVHPILGRTGAGTMYHEIVKLVERGHEDVERVVTRNGSVIHVDIEEAKAALLKLVHESGVEVYLQTPMVEAVMEGDQLTGVLVGSQDGLRVIRANAFVDATGDGFLAARAGAEYRVGRDSDGRCQPTTLEFTIDNIDENVACSATAAVIR